MRINTIKNTILYSLFLLLLTSCHWFQKKEGEVRRSLLMYYVVSPNLSGSIMANLDDVKNSPFVPEYFDKGESGDVLLLVSDQYTDKIPRLKRLYMDEFGVVQEEVLAEYQGETTVDPEFMSMVLTYANTIFPAKESGIIFSSHGTGWIPEGYYSDPSKFGAAACAMEEDPYAHLVKSFGQMDGKEMDIIELSAHLPRKYSYIIFDACLMGNVEVAYELKDKAEYQILSPTEIMAAGFPYSDVIEQAFYAEGALEGRLGAVTSAYYDLYNGQGTGGGTIALVRSSSLNGVATSVKAILDADSDALASLNMSTMQRYFRGSVRHWFYDLGDFMSGLSTDAARLDAFESAMDQAVVSKYATDYFLSIKIDDFSGLGVYIPKPSDSYLDNYYKNLAWNKTVGLIK